MNSWGITEIPGTEGLPSIGVEEIENYSISVTYALDGGRFGDQITNYPIRRKTQFFRTGMSGAKIA